MFNDFLAGYGLLAIFVVMLLKEIGLPIPVPSDLIMITAGIEVAKGSFGLLELGLLVEVAALVGGLFQFALARGAGRPFIYRFGKYIGLTPARLDRAGESLKNRGVLAVFLGLNLPGARAGIVPAAGLAGLSYSTFIPALLAGCAVFYGWHVAFGMLVGPSATTLLDNLHLPLAPIVLGLAVLGLAAWLLFRGKKKAAPESSVVDRVHSWTEAACPVCLAAAVIQHTKATAPVPVNQ